MPIYEYQCKSCGRIFERLQKFSDQPIKTCPFCSGNVSKLISQCTFHLKGTGWYVTDYAGKSQCSSISKHNNNSVGSEQKADNNNNNNNKTSTAGSD